MTSAKEVIDSIRHKIQFGFAYSEARKCRRLWAYYQERPNMFTFAEWHDSLLRWNQYVAEYRDGITSN